MTSLRARAAIVAVVAALAAGAIAVSAHQVTHSGTVVALKTTKYAQPGGGSREVQELEVTVLDAKSRKSSPRVFTITPKTKVSRAGKPVALAQLTAQKDEKVAVVVDHDKAGDEAIEIRFAAAR
jgi:hypothetical protein